MKEKLFWRGKPLEGYTREELIEIIKDLNRQLLAEFKHHRETLNILVPPRSR